MPKRTKEKILVTVALYLLWIILGTLGFLPSFFHDSYMGQSHSVFNPISALLDLILYIFLTYVIVTVIFGVIDSRTKNK